MRARGFDPCVAMLLRAALLLAAACIAGWAFLAMLEPHNMLELLRMFSLC